MFVRFLFISIIPPLFLHGNKPFNRFAIVEKPLASLYIESTNAYL